MFTCHRSIQSFQHSFKKLFTNHLLNLEKKSYELQWCLYIICSFHFLHRGGRWASKHCRSCVSGNNTLHRPLMQEQDIRLTFPLSKKWHRIYTEQLKLIFLLYLAKSPKSFAVFQIKYLVTGASQYKTPHCILIDCVGTTQCNPESANFQTPYKWVRGLERTSKQLSGLCYRPEIEFLLTFTCRSI